MGLLKTIYILKSKKLIASSLTEILVATTLILLVFIITSATINNILNSITKTNTQVIEVELSKLQYLYLNKKINVPYFTENKEWIIEILKHSENTTDLIVFEATHLKSKKKYSKKLIAIEIN
ncbi:hypothetical protein [Tenacibaculum finnmarkense]|uniref:hypothetical protein n=1 Tax=Tenacibaculum finnmarkense TaxID=2781243 RepID=UPI001E33FC6C|nr:hypothetical protein [Tenacibaculum finnmarkense]MCD8406213.1 hypothetical protein [Tenacibaculum dicentrarchi]MCD8413263.1 hypothetical protein [Tenacibaculum finnmarkense genomovar ulcerans]MCG8208216.1 hypothetical protein [Tenacibaculum finnmarkense genomovar finnmarkense]MCG8724230.1 hypothetical protein [Tenacibaculum finnmarkense]MCG8742524.1 hypothetical protein [Tenacibaculum finnmarkense]